MDDRLKMSIRTVDGIQTYAMSDQAYTVWEESCREEGLLNVRFAAELIGGSSVLSVGIFADEPPVDPGLPPRSREVHAYAILSPGFWLEVVHQGHPDYLAGGELIELKGPPSVDALRE